MRLIWDLVPVTQGEDDAAKVPVWVEVLRTGSEPHQGNLRQLPRPQGPGGRPEGLTERSRERFYHLDGQGRLQRLDAGDPTGHATIRTRFRPDLTADSILVDVGGRQWTVDAVTDENGSRRFQVLELAAYAPPPLVDVAGFTPPAGWTLQENGEPVQTLVVGAHVRGAGPYFEYLGVRFEHSNAWTAATFAGTVFECEGPDGRDRRLVLVGVDPSEGLAAGENWPGEGAAMLDSDKELTRKLPIGATVRIRSDN